MTQQAAYINHSFNRSASACPP